MKDVIICTVGTALITNLERSSSCSEPIKAAIKSRNVIATAKLMKSELTSSSRECGAEVNSITSILEKNLIQDKHALYFMVSNTDDGSFVGEVLKLYYKAQFNEVYVKILKGLHHENFSDFRNRGLLNLVRETADIIKKERDQGHEPVINATGGFKAQISFAGLIGQVLEVPVYYMFERFSEVIEMPPMPVSFDFSLWLDNYSALHEIRERGIVPSNDEILKELHPKLYILLYYENDETMLSAMGELFYKGFLDRFLRGQGPELPPPSNLEPKEKKISFDHRPFRGLKNYLEWICEVEYVTRINVFYDNPNLPVRNRFTKSSHGDDFIKGQYSNDEKTARFDVFITTDDPLKVQAAVVDLTNRMIARGVRI
ncbi:putative CRISPR-associated protein [Candidatus Poribacteria bacterium]|nr:putative CRISPR-associated protein [Candidatus Poribacteria bacterium]